MFFNLPAPTRRCLPVTCEPRKIGEIGAGYGLRRQGYEQADGHKD